MSRKVKDPDFGDIEFGAPPSREEYERVGRQAMEAVAARRLWPEGSVSKCPQCGRKAFVGRDDLTHRVSRPGGVLVFRRLRGAKCQACGVQTLEPADLVAVEEEAGVGITADYEAKVSRIGSGSLGTYWPKDVVRTMRLSPHQKAYIQVLDRDTAIVRFAEADDENKRKKKRRS